MDEAIRDHQFHANGQLELYGPNLLVDAEQVVSLALEFPDKGKYKKKNKTKKPLLPKSDSGVTDAVAIVDPSSLDTRKINRLQDEKDWVWNNKTYCCHVRDGICFNAHRIQKLQEITCKRNHLCNHDELNVILDKCSQGSFP